MWLIFARPPRPDAHVWPGRRRLALVDAVAWPVACAALVLGMPAAPGLFGQIAVAWCIVAAFGRAYRAVAVNHRYQFTTWRWGRWIGLLLVVGYAMKLAVLLTALR